MLGGRPGGGVHLEEVGAVDARPREAFVAAGEQVGRATCGLVGDGDGDGVLVVLDEKQHRSTVARGPVQRFVKRTLRRRAVAARAVGIGIRAFPLRREGNPHRWKELGTDGRRDREDVTLGAAEVLRHLPTARVRIVGLGEVVQHHLARGPAQGQVHRQVAVIEAEPVVPGAGEGAYGRLRGFMARTPDVEEPFPLFEQGQHLLVEPPRAEHGAVDVQQHVRLEVAGTDRVDVEDGAGALRREGIFGDGRVGRAIEGRGLAPVRRVLGSVPLSLSHVFTKFIYRKRRWAVVQRAGGVPGIPGGARTPPRRRARRSEKPDGTRIGSRKKRFQSPIWIRPTSRKDKKSGGESKANK